MKVFLLLVLFTISSVICDDDINDLSTGLRVSALRLLEMRELAPTPAQVAEWGDECLLETYNVVLNGDQNKCYRQKLEGHLCCMVAIRANDATTWACVPFSKEEAQKRVEIKKEGVKYWCNSYVIKSVFGLIVALLLLQA